MQLARFQDFKPRFDQRILQLTGQPSTLVIARSRVLHLLDPRAPRVGHGNAGFAGSKGQIRSDAVNKNGTEGQEASLNRINATTTTTPKPSVYLETGNGLLGSDTVRHQHYSREIDEDDDAATLWTSMMKLRNFREKDLFKDHGQQLSEMELKKLFQKKNAEAMVLLKSTSKDVKDKWKMWYSQELNTAKFINKQRNQKTNSVDTMFKKRFGSLGSKFEQGWTESCRDSGDILRDFMPDDSLELTLIKGYGSEWEAHYRKLKESKAEELYKSVVYLREYKSKMTSFMDNKLCIVGGDFDAAEAATLAALEVPSADMVEQLNRFVQEIRIPLKIKVESNRVAETASFQKALEYAFEKYKQLLKKEMMALLERAELAGNSKCNTAMARMAAFQDWDEMQKKVYNIVSSGFGSAPGFEYTSLWKWPDEEPETLKRYNTQERDKYIMCRFNGQQRDLQQSASSASDEGNRSESNRRRPLNSGSESTNALQRKRSRVDFNSQFHRSPSPTSGLSSSSLGPCPAPLRSTNYFVGLHYGSGSTIVQIFSPTGIPKAFLELEDFLGLDQNDNLEPIVCFNSTNRRPLLKLIPSQLIMNHDQISTAEWETSTTQVYFELENDDANQPLHSEEILALHLQQVVNSIKKFGLDPLKAEKVVVAVPAISNSACRRRLKSALDLVGLTNSVLVHTSTAVALSCIGFRANLPCKYFMMTVHLRSGLAEVAVYEVSKGAYTMLGVESSREVRYHGTSKEDSAVFDTVALAEKVLASRHISKNQVQLCAIVVETLLKVKAHFLIQGLEKKLKKAGIHCLIAKSPPRKGILPGLGSVAEAHRSGTSLYQEIFPWNIEVLFSPGFRREKCLVKPGDRAELVQFKTPAVGMSPLEVFVQSLDRQGVMQTNRCLHLKDREHQKGEELVIQVTNEGLINGGIRTASGQVINNCFTGPFMTRNQVGVARERIKHIFCYRASFLA